MRKFLARLLLTLSFTVVVNAVTLPVMAVPCTAAKAASIATQGCDCCEAAADACNQSCAVVSPAPMIGQLSLTMLKPAPPNLIHSDSALARGIAPLPAEPPPRT